MPKRKVAVVVASTDINSGPVKGIIQLLQNQAALNTELLLFNFKVKGIPLNGPFTEGIKSLGFPLHLIDQGGRNYLRAVREAASAMKTEKINIIQTHGFKPSMIGFFLRIFWRIPWVCFMHGTTCENLKVRFFNFLDALFQLKADRVVLVSESQRRKILFGNNTSRVKVIHNSIDLNCPVKRSSVDFTELRKQNGIGNSDKVIVVIGRHSPEKGIDVFIDAFSMICGSTPFCHALIVGDGPERLRLQKKVNQQPYGPSHIHFTGYTETVGDYLSIADVVVIPSRSEGIPNVALEAMALGRPVVATHVGGIPEIIVNGKSGALIPPDNPSELGSMVRKLLCNVELASQLAQGGRERVQRCFSVKARCEAIARLYEEVETLFPVCRAVSTNP